MLISHPYIKIQRKIMDNAQHLIETEEYLTLYYDSVESESDYFRLCDILDISFKSITTNSGFLYLHTTRGVFPFHTKSNPQNFIHTYKNLKEHGLG
ncbi:hypothetical protein [Mesobacillus maritimus]|uniref:hypothetical protein n=1 Tax=Mesobacillus maritimus TaxID=1643336 RepID=UPI00384DE216